MSLDHHSEISYAAGVLVPAFWPSERWPRPVGRVLKLRRDKMMRPEIPISTPEDLKGAIGIENHEFFSACHQFAYRIKGIVQYWDVPGSRISDALKRRLLPAPVKLYGPGKEIIAGAMIDFLFSNHSGIHGFSSLCAVRELISVERGLKLPFSGTGSRSEDTLPYITQLQIDSIVLWKGSPKDLSVQKKAPWIVGLTIHGAAEFDGLAVWRIGAAVDGLVRIANAIELSHEHTLFAVFIYEANCATITLKTRASTSCFGFAVTARAINHCAFFAKLHGLLFGFDLDR